MTAYVEDVWYVLVENQSYGPYSAAHMANFVHEGRVIATSLISPYPQNGFLPAIQVPNFQHWMSVAAQPQTPQAQPHQSIHTRPSSTPSLQAQDYNPAPHNTEPQPQIDKENLFLVMAEINPQTGMSFLRALQSFGHVQRIGDAFWLLKASRDLPEIKASLSATLAKRDRLFIHDCFANQQAWENIGADLDDRIRQIWQGLKR